MMSGTPAALAEIARLTERVAYFEREYQDEIGRTELIENVETAKAEIAACAARIAELEALSAPDAIHRHYMRGYNAANAKRRRYYVAEFESDRDTLSRIIDTLGTDNRRLGAERDRLKAAHHEILAFADHPERMAHWDIWRKAIANGDKGSWPRDGFEAMLDCFDSISRAALSGEGVT